MSQAFLNSSPHAHKGHSTAQLMQLVMLACLPGLAALTWFFGWGTLINIVWLSLCAVALEAGVLWLRKRPVLSYISDCTALLTAVLLGLALPPTAPWWLGLIGITSAIVLAKQLYGGLGYNPFNPAMIGYVVLLISFPVQMTRWALPQGVSESLPSLADSMAMFFGSEPYAGFDAFTGATALDSFRQFHGGQLVSEFFAAYPVMGQWSGVGWEWVNIGFLMGGCYLLFRQVISWHIPVSMLGSIAILALVFHDGGSSASHGSPLLHLLGGATMLGAFFIATDPVSAATTHRGKLVYGTLVGTMVYVIRAWGSYPDGVAFAVLLGNFAAPLIDALTQPRTYGHAK